MGPFHILIFKCILFSNKIKMYIRWAVYIVAVFPQLKKLKRTLLFFLQSLKRRWSHLKSRFYNAYIFSKLILDNNVGSLVGLPPLSWSSAVYGFLAQILSWETVEGQRVYFNEFMFEHITCGIFKVYNIWASGHGQDGETPPSLGQDMGHYDHNKPHSWVIPSYLEILDSQQNQWWSIQNIWLLTPML